MTKPKRNPFERKYNDEEREAVWVLACEGLGPNRISQALADGESALDYKREIPVESVKGILRWLRKNRGSPRANIQPGSEEAHVSAARRHLIGCITVQATDLHKRFAANAEKMSAAEVREADRLLEVLDKITERAAKRKKAMTAAEPSPRPADPEGAALRELARAAKKRGALDAGAPSADASPEPSEPPTPDPEPESPREQESPTDPEPIAG